jgi:hypothetical protein
VDPDATVVVTNAEVRIAVILSVAIQNAATRSVVTQDAMGDSPNAAGLAVVPIEVQDVARAVVIQSAATRCEAVRCVQVAVFQCVADLDAMVVLQHAAVPPNAAVLQNAAAKVLPDGARGDARAGRLALDEVHAVQNVVEVEAAQASEVSQFSVQPPAPEWLPVAQSAALRYCLHRERCPVGVHSRPHYAGSHLPFDSDVRSDRDVHRVVDPVTRVFQGDSLRRLAAVPFAEFQPCLPVVTIQVSVRARGRYVCVSDLHRAPVRGGVPLRRLVDWEYLDAAFESADPNCLPHVRGQKEYSRQFHQYDPAQLRLPDRDRPHCAPRFPQRVVHDARDYQSRRAADA